MWFRKIDNKTAPIENAIGVEVWADHPSMGWLQANLDPQHGGGFGMPPTQTLAACDAALALALSGWRAPEGAVFVTPRVDVDSVLAAMILSGRLDAASIGHSERLLIFSLAALDASPPPDATFTWTGGSMLPQTVGDHYMWGPVAAMCGAAQRGNLTPTMLDALERAVIATLKGGDQPRELLEARAAWNTARHPAKIAALSVCFSVVGNGGTTRAIAAADDLPMGGAHWPVAFTLAPVAVLGYKRPDGSQAFTVAIARTAGKHGRVFIERLNAAMKARGETWAGGAGITGSRSATTFTSAAEVATFALPIWTEVVS